MHLIISKLFQELKNDIESSVGQAVFKIYQNSENVVWINITIFEFLGQFTIRYICIIFQTDVDDFEIDHKTC